MGIKTSIQEFLILEHDSEPLVVGVQWHSSLVGENCGDSTRLVNMDTFGQPMTNPLESTEDKAEEDSILDDANLDVYPGGSEEAPETYNQCLFDSSFPDQDALKSIVRRHGKILSQPFDQEGLRVES